MKTVAITAALAATVAAITPVTVKGNAFFVGNDRFYIRGVDYQPGGASDPVDPIANVKTCKRDIEKFVKLGINTIRIYTVDNTADHDECMKALADAGIYLALDVNNSKYSINREKPAKSYNAKYLENVFATMEVFEKYDNTLLFYAANEVINSKQTTETAPYVKAVVRDMKSYINARKMRKIPVGYSAADVEESRYEMAAYMNCGDDAVRSDFFAFNDYAWCDPSDFKTSGWDQKVEKFKDYSIPIFLSEFGCVQDQRQWKEIKSIYGPDMTSVYSGGLVYEYSVERNGGENGGDGAKLQEKYGLIDLKANPINETSDFTTLQKAFKDTPIPKGDGGYKKDGKASECPTKSTNWDVDIKANELPVLPSGAKALFDNGVTKGPGLTGPGSQEAGEDKPTMGNAADGAVTSGSTEGGGSPSGSPGAAASLRPLEFGMAPFVCGAIVLVSSFLGGSLIF
jgi:hypothetical protein